MKAKHGIEFLICFVSGHDFLASPEHTQKPVCRRCHQPYTETLRDKGQRRKQKSEEVLSGVPPSKPKEAVGIKK